MAFPNPPCQGLRHSHISAGIQPSRNFALSARLRGEREGTRRGGDGEGEVGHAVATEPGLPHLTPNLSAPRDGEGGFNKLFYIGSKMCECRSHQGGGPVSALLFVLPPPRWGRVGVGVMRADCVDSVENRSNRRMRCGSLRRSALSGSRCDQPQIIASAHPANFTYKLRIGPRR